MKKSCALAVILGCILTTPIGRAQAPAATAAPTAVPSEQQATKDQLDKLFVSMHLRDQMQSIMTMMPAMIQQQLAKEPMPSRSDGTQLTPEQQQAVRKLLDSYVQKSMSLYTADEMMADIASVYQRHFTRDDVDAYIAFYSSPAGQHLLDAQPVIMQEYMPVMMERVQGRSKALADQQRKEMEDLINSFDRPAEPAKPQ